jgi:hypothetical protein
MSQNSNQHSVRRIILPSGRTIEVVRFHDDVEHAQPGLHVCPQCDCELVQPVAWTEAAGENWELTLRCPNCMWVGEGVYHPRELERLEKKLDQGVDAILRDLQRLTHANMADQVDRFVEALRSDLILPEDF